MRENSDQHLFATRLGCNDDFFFGWRSASGCLFAHPTVVARLGVTGGLLAGAGGSGPLLADPPHFDFLPAETERLTFFGETLGRASDDLRLLLAKPCH
jgi:hypothetical protein